MHPVNHDFLERELRAPDHVDSAKTGTFASFKGAVNEAMIPVKPIMQTDIRLVKNFKLSKS